MSFSTFNNQPGTPEQTSPWNNLLQNALKNYSQMQEASFLKPNLQEALLKAQQYNKYYGPDKESQMNLRGAQASAIPSQIALHQAQTARANQLTSMPFGGQLAGPAKEAFALELLKKQYGEDSPVYQQAKHSFDTNISAKEGLTNYRGSLSETANKRASSSLGKTAQELEEIDKGFMPGTNGQIPLTPEQQQSLSGQYNLKLQKDVTDAHASKS